MGLPENLYGYTVSYTEIVRREPVLFQYGKNGEPAFYAGENGRSTGTDSPGAKP